MEFKNSSEKQLEPETNSSDENTFLKDSTFSKKTNAEQEISNCSKLFIILYIGLPNSLILIGELLSIVIILHFLGKSSDTLHFAGFGMAFSWYTFSAFFVITGISSGIIVIVSQALGHGNKELCGIYYQRVNVIIKMLGIISTFIQFLCYPTLRLLGYPSDLAYHAGMMAIAFIPIIFLVTHSALIRQFLTAHQVVFPMIFVEYGCLIFHIGWSYFFISVLKWHYYGAAAALVLMNVTGLSIIYIYLEITKVCADSFQPWSCEAFKNWGSFLKVGVPIAIASGLELTSAEINNLLMGSLGPVVASAVTIFWNLEIILVGFSFGCGVGSGVLIGNSLGKSDKETAKKYLNVGIIFVIIIILIFALCLWIFRGFLAQCYTEDPEVINLVVSLMWIESINSFFFGIETFISTTLNFVNQQIFTAILLFMFCYPLVLPASWYFGVHKMNGILASKIVYAIANFTLLVIYSIRMYTLNYNDVIKEIEKRNSEDSKILQ